MTTAIIRDELVSLANAAPPCTAPATPCPGPSRAQNDPASAELQAEFFRIGQIRGLKPEERLEAMAQATIEAMRRYGRFFFHAAHPDFDKTFYFDNRLKLLLPLSSDMFNSRLSDFTGINRSLPAYKFIFAAIQNAALTGSSTVGVTPEAFWAARPGAFYLSNGDGRVARISAAGVSIEDNGVDDVLFPAGKTLRPWTLTNPEDPFSACALFNGISALASHGRDLFRLWVSSLPANRPNKPPLALTGPIGGGKTANAKGVFDLLGIQQRILKVGDEGVTETNLWVALNEGGVVCLDNADSRIRWLPDTLAAAATGGSFSRRKLYSDDVNVVLKAHAAIILTSSDPAFAADPGTADRLIVLRVERRNGETAESALYDEVLARRDAGLSWIAQTLSQAARDTSPVPSGLNLRHPDFAAFAVRIGRAAGRERAAVDALRNAEADKSIFNLENDDLGDALLNLLSARNGWHGTAAELRISLLESESISDDRWTPKKMGKRLDKLWPHLEQVLGAKVVKNRDGVKVYTFRRNPPAGFAGFQTPVSYIPPCEGASGEKAENASPNPANPAPVVVEAPRVHAAESAPSIPAAEAPRQNNFDWEVRV